MMKHHPRVSTATTRLAAPKERQRSAGSAQDEIHCTLCDCSEFRQSRIATVCTCGHHYEDHETPDSMRRKGPRF